MKKNVIPLALTAITILSLFFNNYNRVAAPPCFNADEAAFSYNAYSLFKTGKDEYGTFLPQRLKSFGDYKLPLYSYLSVPFVGIFGLNETSARGLNILLSILFPITIYLFSKELFKREDSALVSALLISTSLALNIVGRHTHEAYLSAYLTILTAYLFLKVQKEHSPFYIISFLISALFLLFSYHPGRIFASYFFVCILIYGYLEQKSKPSFNSKKIITLVGFLIVCSLFIFTDVLYKPERVKNLLFFNNIGFSLKINELRSEGSPRLFYNKLTLAAYDLAHQYSKYFSPEFLTINGDENMRFGYPSMSPITIVEYLFVFVGFYYLFKNKEQQRYYILGLLLLSPLSAALSWAGMSITRSLALFAILPLFSGYGIVHSMYSVSKKYRMLAILMVCAAQLFFLYYSWDFYLNHYAKRATTTRSWQCGYKQMADFIRSRYNSTDTFYITKKNGEPYIFLLFYLNYPPEQYQKQASLSAPDEYGFGQVERFDKFEFNFRIQNDGTKSVSIGYPDDFAGADHDILSNIKKIKVGTEVIFWVYEK